MYVLNSFNNTNHLKNDRSFLNAMQPDSQKNAFHLCSSPQQMINTKFIEEWTVQPELRKCFLLPLTFQVSQGK